MKFFDTKKISKSELVKQLEAADREAGTTERHTSWDNEILKVEWGQQAKPMSITGLQSGAFQDALAKLKQRITEKQNQAVARVVNAHEGASAKIDAAVAGVEAKVDREIEDALQEFAQFTNGGPA